MQRRRRLLRRGEPMRRPGHPNANQFPPQRRRDLGRQQLEDIGDEDDIENPIEEEEDDNHVMEEEEDNNDDIIEEGDDSEEEEHPRPPSPSPIPRFDPKLARNWEPTPSPPPRSPKISPRPVLRRTPSLHKSISPRVPSPIPQNMNISSPLRSSSRTISMSPASISRRMHASSRTQSPLRLSPVPMIRTVTPPLASRGFTGQPSRRFFTHSTPIAPMLHSTLRTPYGGIEPMFSQSATYLPNEHLDPSAVEAPMVNKFYLGNDMPPEAVYLPILLVDKINKAVTPENMKDNSTALKNWTKDWKLERGSLTTPSTDTLSVVNFLVKLHIGMLIAQASVYLSEGLQFVCNDASTRAITSWPAFLVWAFHCLHDPNQDLRLKQEFDLLTMSESMTIHEWSFKVTTHAESAGIWDDERRRQRFWTGLTPEIIPHLPSVMWTSLTWSELVQCAIQAEGRKRTFPFPECEISLPDGICFPVRRDHERSISTISY